MPADLFGVRWVVAPSVSAAALAYVAFGIGLGTVSGLVPGLHANTMAMLLAAAAPSAPGPPRLVGAAMLAAGVVHTFLDVVPALALGVPDPAMAASALPGHRLVLGGRGREALRLSALGSGLAVVLAIPLALPVTLVMRRAYPTLRAHLPLVLVGVVVLLVLTESTLWGAVCGAVISALAGALGLLTLDLSPAAPLDAGGILVALFAGLFGAPVLVEALGGSGVPDQDDARLATTPWAVAGLGALGTVSGALVGYVPGVSAAVAATLALVAVPGRYGARGFVVATSGVNTANAVFALFALVALGSPRTGVLVALDRSGAPLDLPLLLAAIALAAAVGYVLVPVVGDRYLVLAGRVDYATLSLCVLGLLVVLSALFAGPTGVLVLVAASALGLVPARVGARRVHLMGVLLWPLVVG
ncbi:MAG: tripartite tricarboxylate transporter permease [Haloarculaceae archaeon]